MESKSHVSCMKPRVWVFSHSVKGQVSRWACASGEALCNEGQAS